MGTHNTEGQSIADIFSLRGRLGDAWQGGGWGRKHWSAINHEETGADGQTSWQDLAGGCNLLWGHRGLRQSFPPINKSHDLQFCQGANRGLSGSQPSHHLDHVPFNSPGLPLLLDGISWSLNSISSPPPPYLFLHPLCHYYCLRFTTTAVVGYTAAGGIWPT